MLDKSEYSDARMIPLDAQAPQYHQGRLKGFVDVGFFDPLPEEDLALWEGAEGPATDQSCLSVDLPNNPDMQPSRQRQCP